MKEHSGTTHGWVDRGPTNKGPSQHGTVTVLQVDVDGARTAGVWPPSLLSELFEAKWLHATYVETRAPSTKDEIADINRQAKDRPRALTFEEDALVTKNRRIAKDDLGAMERWYRSEVSPQKQEPENDTLDRDEYSLGRPHDKVLLGIEEGDVEPWYSIIY